LFLDPENKKIIPTNIAEMLIPRSLAFWIMDDGQQVKRGGVTLCTDSFKSEEVGILRNALNSKFNLITSIHNKKGNNDSNYERIYINKSSLEDIKPLLKEHMHESMLYKINENQIETTDSTSTSTSTSPSASDPSSSKARDFRGANAISPSEKMSSSFTSLPFLIFRALEGGMLVISSPAKSLMSEVADRLFFGRPAGDLRARAGICCCGEQTKWWVHIDYLDFDWQLGGLEQRIHEPELHMAGRLQALHFHLA